MFQAHADPVAFRRWFVDGKGFTIFDLAAHIPNREQGCRAMLEALAEKLHRR